VSPTSAPRPVSSRRPGLLAGGCPPANHATAGPRVLEHQQGPLADDATMLLTDGAAATSMTSHPYGLVRRPTVRGGVSVRPRPSGGADSAGNPRPRSAPPATGRSCRSRSTQNSIGRGHSGRRPS
jgi:hypothetical protein